MSVVTLLLRVRSSSDRFTLELHAYRKQEMLLFYRMLLPHSRHIYGFTIFFDKLHPIIRILPVPFNRIAPSRSHELIHLL